MHYLGLYYNMLPRWMVFLDGFLSLIEAVGDGVDILPVPPRNVGKVFIVCQYGG